MHITSPSTIFGQYVFACLRFVIKTLVTRNVLRKTPLPSPTPPSHKPKYLSSWISISISHPGFLCKPYFQIPLTYLCYPPSHSPPSFHARSRNFNNKHSERHPPTMPAVRAQGSDNNWSATLPLLNTYKLKMKIKDNAKKNQILFHINKKFYYHNSDTIVLEFWLQFFRILFSDRSVGLEKNYKSLCIHILWCISLRFRVQNFRCYRQVWIEIHHGWHFYHSTLVHF